MGIRHGALLWCAATCNPESTLPLCKPQPLCSRPCAPHPHQAFIWSSGYLPFLSDPKGAGQDLYKVYVFFFLSSQSPTAYRMAFTLANLHLDESCHLFSPHATFTPDRALIDKVISCLCTSFSALPAAVRAALPRTFDQWAKFRILPAGDTIRAAEMETHAEDGRDATYVRVRFHVLSSCFVF